MPYLIFQSAMFDMLQMENKQKFMRTAQITKHLLTLTEQFSKISFFVATKCLNKHFKWDTSLIIIRNEWIYYVYPSNDLLHVLSLKLVLHAEPALHENKKGICETDYGTHRWDIGSTMWTNSITKHCILCSNAVTIKYFI